MNRLDTMLQGIFPTVMVPKHGQLPACREKRARLLAGADGLYLEAMMPWGRIVARLWENPRQHPLPYGHIEECYEDFFRVLEEVGPIIRSEAIPRAAEYAERSLEWAGWVVYNGSGFEYLEVDFESTACSAKVKWPVLNGKSLVVDMHSHGKLEPGFSGIDDRDDAGGIKICVVFGDFRDSGPEGERSFAYLIRFAAEGFFVDAEFRWNGEERLWVR